MGIFRKIFSSWILWFYLISIFMIGAAFYLSLGKQIESTITQQILDRKRIIARAEVGNITVFFERFGNAVATLAQVSSIDVRNADTVSDMDTFVKQRSSNGFVGRVVLTDKNGVVQFNSNVLGTRDLGASLADRDYFIWANTKGEKGKYFISQPAISRLGASKGHVIIVVASPVYQNGTFTGVMAAAVKLEPLAKHFLDLMKISDLTEVYLVDGNGDLLYSNVAPDAVGSKFDELFSGDSALKDRIKKALGAAVGDQFRTKQHLIAYSPVKLGTQSWLLIISSTPQEVESLAMPLYIRQAAMLILTATALLLGTVVIRKRNHS